MRNCVIKKCECINEYQDKKYGYGNRVFNINPKTGTGHCTVCGKQKSTPKEIVIDKKD